MRFEGYAHVFGDDISTDIHISAKYRPPGTTLAELKEQMFNKIRSDFYHQIEPGDFIIAGNNFGKASSREDSAEVLREVGISAVIASSFCRLFYRNALNLGLPAIICDTSPIEDGERLLLDLEENRLISVDKKREYPIKPVEEFIKNILKDGGIVSHIKNHKGYSTG